MKNLTIILSALTLVAMAKVMYRHSTSLAMMKFAVIRR